MRINILRAMNFDQLGDMIYMKNSGEVSKRRIKVLSISEDSFKAYCFLKGTKRTFKIENVLAFVPVVKRERDVI